MKKAFLVLSFLLSIYANLYAASSSAGTTVADFLKLGAGAPGIGMGNSQVSVLSNSSDAIYWNPAALASLNRMDASLMYSSYFEDMAYGWLGFGMPTSVGTFGFGVQYFSAGSLEGRDENGDLTSSFTPSDYAVYLSYANRVYFSNSSVIRYGANLKYISSTIENTATAFAIDAGAIYTLSDGITSFGAAVQNLGTKMKFNVDDENLPLTFKVGASRIFFDNLLISLDAVIPSDNNIFPAIGAQYTIPIMKDANIALRVGYNGMEQDVPGFSGFNAGFGAQYKDFRFDYAFSPYGDLGTANRVSIGIKFGSVLDESQFKKKASVSEPAAAKTSAPAAQSQTQGQAQAPANVTTESMDYTNPSDVASQQQQPQQQQAAAQPQQQAQPQAAPTAQAQQPATTTSAVNLSIMGFVSQTVSKSELNVYSSMLNKAFEDNPNFNATLASQSVTDASLVQSELTSLFSQTGADQIITASVVNNANGGLTFNINVYYKNMTVKKYVVNAEDSFRDVQAKLKAFAASLSK